MLRELYRDYETHERKLTDPGFLSLAVYRYGRWAEAQPEPLRRVVTKVYGVLRLATQLSSGVVIETGCELGDGFHIVHGGNIHIHPEVVVGRRCGIMHDVTLGATLGREGAPTLGDDVYVGPGAKVLGPVKVGDGALIAANSLVITDVPAGATAIGVPARILPHSGGVLRARTNTLRRRSSGAS